MPNKPASPEAADVLEVYYQRGFADGSLVVSLGRGLISAILYAARRSYLPIDRQKLAQQW
ncbi:MAG: hypothetical protein P8X39_08045 [Desulfofustis sp.]